MPLEGLPVGKILTIDLVSQNRPKTIKNHDIYRKFSKNTKDTKNTENTKKKPKYRKY